MKHEKIKKALAIVAAVLFSLLIIVGIVFSILSDKDSSVASADEVQQASIEEYTTYYYINAGTVIGTSTGTKTFEKIKNTEICIAIELSLEGETEKVEIASLSARQETDEMQITIISYGWLEVIGLTPFFIDENTILETPIIFTITQDYITQDRTLWDNWIEALGIEVENDLRSFTYSPNGSGGVSGSYGEGYDDGYDDGWYDGYIKGSANYRVDIRPPVVDNVATFKNYYFDVKSTSAFYVPTYQIDGYLITAKIAYLYSDPVVEDIEMGSVVVDVQCSIVITYYAEYLGDNYLPGYNLGYNNGLNKGQSDSFTDPVSYFLLPVHNFLSLNLFGTFSIGSLFSVVLFVSLALIFIKMFSGG